MKRSLERKLLKISLFLNVSKNDFFEGINFTPYQQAKRHTNSEGVEQNGKTKRM